MTSVKTIRCVSLSKASLETRATHPAKYTCFRVDLSAAVESSAERPIQRFSRSCIHIQLHSTYQVHESTADPVFILQVPRFSAENSVVFTSELAHVSERRREILDEDDALKQ